MTIMHIERPKQNPPEIKFEKANYQDTYIPIAGVVENLPIIKEEIKSKQNKKLKLKYKQKRRKQKVEQQEIEDSKEKMSSEDKATSIKENQKPTIIEKKIYQE